MTGDDAFEVDRVSPPVEGYFRIPAIWVGNAPDDPDPPAPCRHETVLLRELKCGVRVRVQRDGVFLFDFENWPLAPITEIPGYKRPPLPYVPPTPHTAARELAEVRAAIRAQVMNVHQACMATAEIVISRRATTTGFPVTAWNTFKAFQLGDTPPYHTDVTDMRALARNVLNGAYRVDQLPPRQLVELAVVNHSFDLLDEILIRSDIAVIDVVDAAYLAASRAIENRLGECIALAWTACEQLVTIAWKRLLSQINATRPPDEGVSGKRRGKLLSRDYTASVMVEMLELHGVIPHKLYRSLEVVRKARNDWAHEMRQPGNDDLWHCRLALQDLLMLVERVRIDLQFSFRGAVPTAPKHIWDQIRGTR